MTLPLFRQYLKDKNEFHYWGFVDGFVCPVSKNHDPDQIHEQYSGLKDKNGVKIFEGDIVKHIRTNHEVKFGYFIEDFGHTYASTHGWYIDDINTCALDNDVVIIGNIHENPELIGEE